MEAWYFRQEINIRFFPQKINILLGNANKIAAQQDQGPLILTL